MTHEDAFNAFWRHYPRGRKTAKADARRLFIKIITGKHKDLKATPEQLIWGAQRYAAAMGDHHPYVKKPSTWLNGGCWEDEDLAPPEVPQPAPRGLQLSAPQSTRARSVEDDLNDKGWAE